MVRYSDKAENIRNTRDMMRIELQKHLPHDFKIEKELGIIQTSIGKMVPLLTEKDKSIHPLIVLSEYYNQLIIDALAFLNPIPDYPEIKAVQPMEAFEDRKIYIHNLGHCHLQLRSLSVALAAHCQSFLCCIPFSRL